jgi:hypothetical protein
MTLEEQLLVRYAPGSEMIRLDKEIALTGVNYRRSHRVVNEMIRFWADVEGVVDLLSDRWKGGRCSGPEWFVVEIACPRRISPQCESAGIVDVQTRWRTHVWWRGGR